MNRHDRTEAVGALLVEAEGAHAIYETTELHGVYDEEWPRWYATYAIEHGLGELLGRPVSADTLTVLLASAFAEFKGADPTPGDSWADWIARRIASDP